MEKNIDSHMLIKEFQERIEKVILQTLRLVILYPYSLVILILLVSACSRTPSDFQEESRQEVSALIELLEGISTEEELAHKQQLLTQQFNQLVDHMIAIQIYQKKYRVMWEPREDDLALSDQLRHELHRILRLEGAKIIMEKCQAESLEKLEQYERKCQTSKIWSKDSF